MGIISIISNFVSSTPWIILKYLKVSNKISRFAKSERFEKKKKELNEGLLYLLGNINI